MQLTFYRLSHACSTCVIKFFEIQILTLNTYAVLYSYTFCSATQQATQWSGRSSLNCGSSCEQISIATGQRGWKRQPFGGFKGLGTSPFKIVRCLFKRGFGTGMADMSAIV